MKRPEGKNCWGLSEMAESWSKEQGGKDSQEKMIKRYQKLYHPLGEKRVRKKGKKPPGLWPNKVLQQKEGKKTKEKERGWLLWLLLYEDSCKSVENVRDLFSTNLTPERPSRDGDGRALLLKEK